MSNIFQRAQRKIAFILANTLTLLALGFAGPGIAYAQDGVAVPIRADIGQTIQLDPSDGFSAAAAGVLTPVWSWVSRPAVSVAEFSDAGVLRPFVTPDVAGVYVARLDMFLDGSSEPVESILAAFGTENLAPVAQVRGRALPDGEGALTLDGSASYDVDGDALNYSWSVVSAPADSDVVFATPTAPLTEISFTGSGEFVFGLTVQDSFGNISAVDTFAVDIGAGQLGRSCTAETATLLPNSGAQRVTFDIGDMTNGPAVNYVIPSFDTDRGGETSFDTLNFTYLGVPYSLSTVQSFVDFVGYFETDGDNTSDAIISKNSNERYLCFTFGTGRGSVLLENVVDRDLTRKKLLAQSADFPEIQDFFLSQYDVTLPNSGARNVNFDLGDVTNGPAVNYLIPSFDTDRGGERSFDTLTFTYRGKSYALSTVQDFLWFTGFIEHDGDRLSDALISENAAVDHLTFTFGANRSSVTLENVIDRHLKRSKLKRRSVDYYEPPLTQTVGGMRAVAPVASFGFDGVRGTIGDGIVLDGYASTDLDGGALSADVSLVAAPVGSAPTVTLGTDGFVSVTADTAGDYLVSLGVSDGQRDGADHLVVSVDGNLRPVARIAPTGLAALGQEIVLDGTQSYDLNGDMVAHAWSILSAPAASVAQIGDAQSALATFTPDVDGTYVLQLIVTDDLSTSVPTTVVIIPGAPLPLADAGPDQRVDAAGSAILDGGLSSVDQGTFAWSVLGLSQGGAAALADATQIIPTVTLPSGTTGGFLPSVVQLVVADSNGIALPDTVVASGGMIRPTVVAGTKMTATVGQPVDLMASDYGFDANGDPLSYRWSLIQRPIGSAASIDSVSSAQTVASPALSFVADRTGFYLIQLEANDGHLNAVPAVIVLEVTNSAPTAVAAAIPDTFIGTSAVLDGSASFDPDNNALNYFWAVTSRPAGSTAFIADPAAAVTSFTPDVKGNYTFALSVSDFELSSVPDTTSLSVPNQAPTIALVPPMSTAVGNIAVFDASASTDPDGDPLTFGIDVAGPVGSAAQTTELPGGVFEVGLDVAGDYTVTVSVSDGIETVPETISFTVAPGNEPPILGDLRDVYTVELGLELALDLTAVDPDGDLVTFFADPLPLPTGVSLDAATGALRYRPEAGQEGDYTLTLGVSDGTLTDVADVTITVVPGTASDTSVFGVVLDAVDFGNGITTPLVGMPVRLEGASLATTTDATGTFRFGSLAAGPDNVLVQPDPTSAGGRYLPTQRVINVTANQDRDLSPNFLLTPLNEGCVDVVAGQVTSLVGAASAISLEFAADTIVNADGTPYTGQVCLGSLPQQTAHDGFPADTLACQIYGVSAPGATFSTGATIIAPNLDNLPETTQLTLWQQSRSIKSFTQQSPKPVPAVSASASSRLSGYGGDPDTVYDGDPNSYTHTLNGPSEFIEIDLGAEFPLTEIRVINRFGLRDAARLNDATVVIYDSLRNEVFRSEPIAGATSGEEFLFDLGRLGEGRSTDGRYVAVQHSNQWLHVSEISAFEYVSPNPTDLSRQASPFRRIAGALVDPGAATVQSTNVGISNGGLFTFLPQAPQTVASDDQPTGNRQLSVFDGNLNEVYTLPGYFAFNRQQQVGLSYHSTAADPTVIVAGDVAIADNASLPVTMSTQIAVGGLSIASDVDWTPRQKADGSTPALIGEAVSMRQSMPVDATGLSSGRYPYTFLATANYDCSTVSAQHTADLYVQNEANSPYGTGWSIDGLQKLVVADDGSVSVIDDDGIVTFDPKPTLTDFDGEPISFPVDGTYALDVADFDGNGFEDIVMSEIGTGSISFIYNFGNREFEYDPGTFITEPNDVPLTGSYPLNLGPVLALDYDEDGDTDIILGNADASSIDRMTNDSLGRFDHDPTLFEIGRNHGVVAFDYADIDQDGLKDLYAPAYYQLFFSRSGSLFVNFGETTELISAFPVPSSGFSTTILLDGDLADFDGDGDLDIAYRTRSRLQLVYNEGSRTFSSTDENSVRQNTQREIGKVHAFLDVDLDGTDDLIIGGTNALNLYLLSADRTISEAIPLPLPAGLDGSFTPRIADANGDGIDDLLVNVPTPTDDDPPLYVYESNGDGTFQPFTPGFVAEPINELAFADLNGDGSLDLVSSQRKTVTINFSLPTASGEFVSGAGEFSELTKLPDGTFERRYKDGMVVVFDATGLQTAEVDPQGNRREFAYGDDSRLETVTDQVGGVTSFTYDALGRMVSTTYPDGRTTTFSYDDAEGTLDEITEPTGSKVSFEYDDDGRLVSTTNQNGNNTSYSYDDTGRLSTATLPDGSNIAASVAASLGLADGLGNTGPLFYIAPEDRVTKVTDRKGEVTEVIVNQFGSPIQITDPLGRVTRMTRNDENLVTRVERPSDAIPGGVRIDEIEYDRRANVTRMAEAVGTPQERSTAYSYEPVFNKVISMTDTDGFTTAYAYDAFGEVTSVIDPEGGAVLSAYNAEGKVTSRTDENGNETTFIYNASQNLSQMTYADGSITTMIYDATGNTTAVNEAVGTPIARQVQRTYDRLNRVLTVEVTGADGAQIDGITAYTYAPAGNLATVTDETGLVTTMSYDALERLVTLDDPAEGVIQRTYNDAGEVTQHINGAGETHQYAYDDVSRLTQTTDPEGFIKAFAYDSRNNVTSVTDGRGGVTTFGFDPLDRMTTRTNPIGQTMTRAYDGRDNLSTLTREDGLVETASYDGLGRRTQVLTPDNTLSYAYDARSNLTEAADNDSRVSFAYDERNRLASTTTDGTVGPQPEVTISYTYDELDRRTSMSDSLGGTTTYAYDFEDRLTDLTAPWGTVYSFGYDGEGRRTSLTSTAGRDTSYAYTNGLLSALRHAQSGVALTDLEYAYDVDGQLTAITDQLDPTKSLAINYDDLNRLVQVDQGIPVADGGVPIPIEDYAYDGEGNRLASHLSSLYTSSTHNQLLEDDSYTYAYDQRGNRTSRTTKADGAVETYTYDSQNRLVGYVSDTTTASYAYDAMERRIAKTVGADTTAYAYDTSMENPLAQDDIILEFEAGSTPVLERRWAHSTAVDEPLGFEQYLSTEDPGTGIERAMFADRQGSILYVTSPATEDVVAAYEYDGFGRITQSQGTMQQPYGYTGREFDAESGLYYYRARLLDPFTGQFLQSDPIGFEGGEPNIYSYVGNDPSNNSDPEGLRRRSGGTAGTSRTEAIILDEIMAEARAEAITAVAEGVFGVVGHITGSLALSQAQLDAVATSLQGGKNNKHHCFPVYMSGDRLQGPFAIINRRKHEFMHKAMQVYTRSFNMSFSRMRPGAIIRIRFDPAEMRRVTRAFYDDMALEFGQYFGC